MFSRLGAVGLFADFRIIETSEGVSCRGAASNKADAVSTRADDADSAGAGLVPGSQGG